MQERIPDPAQTFPTPPLFSKGGCAGEITRGRLRLGQPGGVLESVRVVGTGNGLLGHPESESSRKKKLRAHRALRPERKLGGSNLSWKVEAKLCRGS